VVVAAKAQAIERADKSIERCILNGILVFEELEKLPAYIFLFSLDGESSFIVFPCTEYSFSSSTPPVLTVRKKIKQLRRDLFRD
jgi:hypothetical protein